MLAQQSPQDIDASGAGAHPLRPNPVQPDDRLLLHALDRDRRDLAGAHRFQQGVGVGAVGLIPTDVGSHVGRRQQRDRMAVRLRPAPPVVGRATRLHHDMRRRGRRQKLGEPVTREPLAADDPPALIGHRQLKHRLCEVDTHCRSIHLGLLLVALMVGQQLLRHLMLHRSWEESIPSW